MTALPVEFIPGLVPAVDALRAAVDRSDRPLPLVAFAQVVMVASRPHVQAETLADLSDLLAEDQPELAAVLDTLSHKIREALNR